MVGIKSNFLGGRVEPKDEEKEPVKPRPYERDMMNGDRVAPPGPEAPSLSGVPTPETTRPLSPSDDAAIKIQAFRLGILVRRQTVMPSEIKKYLEQNLQGVTLTPDALDDMSRALARQIVDFAQNPDRYGEHGLRLARDAVYSFPHFNKDNAYIGKRQFKLPIDALWVKKSADGNGIELEMVAKQIGNGGYKTVYQSRPLQISLDSIRHEKSIQESVLVQARSQRANAIIKQGVAALAKVFSPEELQNPNLRVAGKLTHVDRVSPAGVLEARDVEYRGDLKSLFKSMTPQQIRQALSDVATTLELLHQKGYVHGDVKPENILLDKDGRAYLSDFDTLAQTGTQTTRYTPGYLDLLASPPEHQYGSDDIDRKPLLTPYTDIYAMAKTAEDLLLGENLSLYPKLQKALEHLREGYDFMPGWLKAKGIPALDVLNNLRSREPEKRVQGMRDLNKRFHMINGFLQALKAVSD